MKLINDIKNIKNLSKERLVFSSLTLILILGISYFSFDFMSNSYESTVENPLSTKSFTILSDFKKNSIDFTKIYTVFEKIFNYTTEINIKINPSAYEGRYNPFSI